MPNKIELELVLKDSQAKTSASNLARTFASIERDASGSVTKIVDKYANALGQMETYVLKVGKSGETLLQTQISDFSKVSSIIEKNNAAWDKARQKAESVSASFSKISKETSVFGQLSDKAFQSYSKGIISADEALKTTNDTIQYSTKYWQEYYNQLAGVGQQCGVTAKEASVFGQISDDVFQRYSSGAMSGADATATLSANTKKLGTQAESTSKKVDLLQTAFSRLATIAISAVTRSFRDALKEMKNVDSELVVVKKVTDASAEELERLKDRAYDTGKAYGVAASDYLSSAAEFSRAGYKDQAADLAELAVKLQLVGDVSQDTANQFLIATDKAYGFKGNAEELATVIDQLNEIDNNFATSIQKMADGMGIIAPIASQAHVSITELEAAIGTITATTQRSGSESARALRALFLNIMGDTKTEIEDGATWTAGEIEGLRDVLNLYASDVVKAAEATGEVINPMKAIGALAESYKSGVLTEARLMEMVSDIGGKLRSSQLMALIQNWDMYNQMLEKTSEAVGSADKEVENALTGWEAKINILKNTWTDFIQQTISSDLVKDGIDALTWLIDAFGNLGTVIAVVAPIIVAFNAKSIVGLADSIQSKALPAIWNFITAVTGTGDAATVASASISVWSAVIAAAVIALVAINKAQKDYQQSLSENAEKSFKTAKASAQEAETLNKLYDAYKNAKTGSAEQRDASEKLREALELEKDAVDNLSGSYQQLVKERTEKALADANEATAKAAMALENKATRAYSLGFYVHGKDGVPASISNSALQLLFDYEKAEWNAETIYSLYQDLIKLQDDIKLTAYKTDDDSLFSSPLYNSVSSRIELIEEEAEAYDKAYNSELQLQIKQSLWDSGALNRIKTQEDFNNALKEGADSSVRGYGEALKTVLEGYFPQFVDGSNKVTTSLKDQALAALGLSDELSNATAALTAYQKALEGGEKGDTLKSYAEAYKEAMSLFEQGLTGTNQYISAVDLLLPSDVLAALRYNYEEAGQLLGSDFYKALFDYGGEDFGANAADFLKDNASAFKQFYSVIEDSDGGFRIAINDISGLSKALGISENTLWAMIDAWDAFDSASTASIADLNLLKEQFTDVNTGAFNFVGLISDLVAKGKTNAEIRNIVQGLTQMEDVDLSGLPDNLTKAIEDARTLNEKMELMGDGFEIKVETDPSDVTSIFDPLKKEIDTISGTPVVIRVVYKGTSTSPFITGTTTGGYGSNFIGALPQHAKGIKRADAGFALVNEEGAELISSKGKAYIANGGNIGIANLKQGDTVYNAQETKRILGSLKPMDIAVNDGNSGVTKNPNGNGAVSSFAGSTFNSFLNKFKDKNDETAESKKSGGGGGGGKSAEAEVKDSELLSMLDDYISEMLDKAKKALDAQIDTIDAQIEKLKNEHDAEEEANELEELRLKIMEAEKNLVDANVERTVRYFNKATGQWEWMADQKAVAQAQKSLEDAQQAYYDKLADIEYQAKLDELQAQKDALNENYDNLSDTWGEIKDEISKALSEKDVLELAEILTRLGLTAASGSVGGVNTLISDIDTFTGSFDNGGFALGKGFLRKATGRAETVLDEETTARILSPQTNAQFTGFTNSLSKLFGMSRGDVGAKAQSLINTIDRSSNITGDTYYINGVRIGNDMLDRPLSEVLSVLPIYAG